MWRHRSQGRVDTRSLSRSDVGDLNSWLPGNAIIRNPAIASLFLRLLIDTNTHKVQGQGTDEQGKQ